MTLQEFLKKHGKDKLTELVKQFILEAPAFEGDCRLAGEIGRVVADLEDMFTDETRRRRSESSINAALRARSIG